MLAVLRTAVINTTARNDQNITLLAKKLCPLF